MGRKAIIASVLVACIAVVSVIIIAIVIPGMSGTEYDNGANVSAVIDDNNDNSVDNDDVLGDVNEQSSSSNGERATSTSTSDVQNNASNRTSNIVSIGNARYEGSGEASGSLNDDETNAVATIISLIRYACADDERSVEAIESSNIPRAYQSDDNILWVMKKYDVSYSSLIDGEQREVLTYGKPVLLQSDSNGKYYKIPVTFKSTKLSFDSESSDTVSNVSEDEYVRIDSDGKVSYWKSEQQ